MNPLDAFFKTGEGQNPLFQGLFKLSNGIDGGNPSPQSLNLAYSRWAMNWNRMKKATSIRTSRKGLKAPGWP